MKVQVIKCRFCGATHGARIISGDDKEEYDADWVKSVEEANESLTEEVAIQDSADPVEICTCKFTVKLYSDEILENLLGMLPDGSILHNEKYHLEYYKNSTQLDGGLAELMRTPGESFIDFLKRILEHEKIH